MARAMTDPRDRREVHFRVRWFRPRFQGGDTQHPLCRVPVIGWAGPSNARVLMSDEVREVECLACQRELARGGLSARLARHSQNARTGSSRKVAA